MTEVTTTPVFVKVETTQGTRRINMNQIVSTRPMALRDGNGVFVQMTDGTQWEVRGGAAYALESVLDEYTTPSITAPRELLSVPMPQRRPDYCDTPEANRAAYSKAMRAMFGACSIAGCDTSNGDEMRAVINVILDEGITSRKQLTPAQMFAVADAADRGEILPGWHLASDREALAA